MHPYSNSRLVDVNQCPTWGVVSAKKRYKTEARSMALEAGSAMHEVYAAVRLWQLEHIQKLPEHALVNANRIFSKGSDSKNSGMKRWKACIKECTGKDERDYLMQLCFAILNSSGWYDDPNDNVRTMSNMEMSAIHYVDERLPHMDNWPIYVEDEKDPTSRVGIEQTFDVVLLFSDGKQIRFIGTIDGLVIKLGVEQDGSVPYCLDENKTASRLDAGWRNSFDMVHQVTGYCKACSIVFGFPVLRSRVTGAKIKPTNKGEDVYALEPLIRTEEVFQTWGRWMHHSVSMIEQWQDDYENAPRYTHSCNRYFRPCSLLSFCCDTAEGRKEQYAQMIPANPSPSERAVQEL